MTASRKIKAVKFAKAVLAGKTYKQAAVEVIGTKPSNAEHAGHVWANKPEVKSILEAALDKAGATVMASAAVIAKGHKAKKYIGETMKEVEDTSTQLKAAELNLKARKLIGNDTSSIQNNVQFNFIDKLSSELQSRGGIFGASQGL